MSRYNNDWFYIEAWCPHVCKNYGPDVSLRYGDTPIETSYWKQLLMIKDREEALEKYKHYCAYFKHCRLRVEKLRTFMVAKNYE